MVQLIHLLNLILHVQTIQECDVFTFNIVYNFISGL